MKGNHKSAAIYSAVHEVVMRFRVRVGLARKAHGLAPLTDADLASLQHAAASAAVYAYETPLRRGRAR